MKAVQIHGAGPELREVPSPRILPGEARIRVHLAGICNTDLEMVKGYAGFSGTLGHEFVGTVEEAAEADSGWVGRRVVGEINLGCREPGCAWCGAGLERHCPGRSVLGIQGKDGCMAEYLTLPVRNLLPVPGGLPDHWAVFVEPLAAGFEILEQVHLEPASRVAILGDGKLGLLVNRALRFSPARLTHIGKHPRKLALAAEGGVRTLLASDPLDERFDVVVEATGSAAGLERALGLVRPRGTLVLKTTVARPAAIDLTRIVVDEITLLGSRCGRFEPALRALAQGLDPSPLIQARFPLKQAVRAFQEAGSPGALKVLLEMGA